MTPAKESQARLWVEMPEGLNAGATLPVTWIECQWYFAVRRLQLPKSLSVSCANLFTERARQFQAGQTREYISVGEP